MEEPPFRIVDFPATAESHFMHGVTSAATSSKVILLGYEDGSVALFDVFGDPLDLHKGRHSGPVVAVSLGGGLKMDDVAASAGADGTLRANFLFDSSASELSATLSSRTGLRTRVPRGITAIAVDPDYGKPRSGERVSYADKTGRVVFYTSGWFGGSETILVSAGEHVHCMTWVGYLLAWSTLSGVNIYDCRIKQMVCFVESPVSVKLLSSSQTACESVKSHTVDALVAGENEKIRNPNQEGSITSAEDTKYEWKSKVRSEADREYSVVDEHADEAGETVLANADNDDISGQTGGGSSEVGRNKYVEKNNHGIRLHSSLEISDLARTGISLHFEIDENSPATEYGERSQSLYIAWPSIARIVCIGPHKERQLARPGNAEHRDKPPREVRTALSIHRDKLMQLFVAESSENASPARLLGIAPFGELVAILVVTVSDELMLVKLSRTAENDVRCMNLERGKISIAEMHSIPGGEPLLLFSAQRKVDVSKSNDVLLRDENLAGPMLDNYGTTGIGDSAPKQLHCTFFARTLSTAERVKWLLDYGMFAEALKTAEAAPIGSLSREDVSIAEVGDHFLESIASAGDYDRLAEVLPKTITSTSPAAATRGYEKVMRIRQRRWEQWIKVFRNGNKLALVAPLIPCHDPQLDQNTYNDILSELAETNPSQLLVVLKTWPSHVYDVPCLTRVVESQMTRSGDISSAAEPAYNGSAREALFLLYGISGRHDETLNLLQNDRSPRIFAYIRSHNLYEAIRSVEALQELYIIDETQATELLVNAPTTVLSPETIVPILIQMSNRKWLCQYLHSMFRRDPDRAHQYHPMLLELLVQIGPHDSLYNFLKTSSHFSLDAALNLMGGRSAAREGLFRRERVYVLATMGDLGSAMNVLLHELNDVNGAIEFASEHDDMSLWDRLIDHARDDADTLAALLDSPAGGKVNPIHLIPLISSDMEIPNLRDRLHRILIDAASERALREETAAALNFDASQLMKQLDKAVAGPFLRL